MSVHPLQFGLISALVFLPLVCLSLTPDPTFTFTVNDKNNVTLDLGDKMDLYCVLDKDDSSEYDNPDMAIVKDKTSIEMEHSGQSLRSTKEEVDVFDHGIYSCGVMVEVAGHKRLANAQEVTVVVRSPISVTDEQYSKEINPNNTDTTIVIPFRGYPNPTTFDVSYRAPRTGSKWTKDVEFYTLVQRHEYNLYANLSITIFDAKAGSYKVILSNDVLPPKTIYLALSGGDTGLFSNRCLVAALVLGSVISNFFSNLGLL